MAITMNDLTISPEGIDMDTLLVDWSWAMPEPLRPVMITAMGDLFAQGESGAVYFVDTGEGSIDPIADDGLEFESLLKNTEFVTTYLFPSRVVNLRQAGKSLAPQQVYSHKHPLVLGGDDDSENVEATDVSIHVSIQGQIHRQVAELPDGASIDSIQIR